MEAFHLQRTRFEMIVERKLRRRQLTDTDDVEITGRDFREKTPPVGQGNLYWPELMMTRHIRTS
jgi:hypothetical protein